MDWWDAIEIGALTLTATPSRHFSGRGVTGQDRMLWAGWAIRGPQHRVYYSGDTALDDTMTEIGTRLGPFDLTMIEIGEYDPLWVDVHLGPEQAVRAHQLVRGAVMLPVHWAGFDLALHSWTEPIERLMVAAAASRRSRGDATARASCSSRPPWVRSDAGGRRCRGGRWRRRRRSRREPRTSCASPAAGTKP